ncbi:hypothetical protein [Parashewanella tropica]|uniref:hypothetical protein n=1 Tax=Parashewanella tropica TaxID=2547970 RepID=UPI001059FCCC|nr:hypothetical protein [Parashewanella tropica]
MKTLLRVIAIFSLAGTSAAVYGNEKLKTYTEHTSWCYVLDEYYAINGLKDLGSERQMNLFSNFIWAFSEQNKHSKRLNEDPLLFSMAFNRFTSLRRIELRKILNSPEIHLDDIKVVNKLYNNFKCKNYESLKLNTEGV